MKGLQQKRFLTFTNAVQRPTEPPLRRGQELKTRPPHGRLFLPRDQIHRELRKKPLSEHHQNPLASPWVSHVSKTPSPGDPGPEGLRRGPGPLFGGPCAQPQACSRASSPAPAAHTLSGTRPAGTGPSRAGTWAGSSPGRPPCRCPSCGAVCCGAESGTQGWPVGSGGACRSSLAVSSGRSET